jgi:hypothetical protein
VTSSTVFIKLARPPPVAPLTNKRAFRKSSPPLLNTQTNNTRTVSRLSALPFHHDIPTDISPAHESIHHGRQGELLLPRRSWWQPLTSSLRLVSTASVALAVSSSAMRTFFALHSFKWSFADRNPQHRAQRCRHRCRQRPLHRATLRRKHSASSASPLDRASIRASRIHG